MNGPFNNIAAPKPAPGELVAAADRNDLEAVKDLLRRHADIDEKDGHENTALLIAVGACNEEMACLLIDGGASVDIKDRHGDTALMYAAFYGHHEWARRIAQKLIDKGASLGEKNNSGDTVFAVARVAARTQGRSGVEFLEMLKTAAAVRKTAEEAATAEEARKDRVGNKQDTLRGHAPKLTIKRAS